MISLLDPANMQCITLTSAETNCDFQYGEGWVTFFWITSVGLDASLKIDLDGHCSREMPIRSGSDPEIVDVAPDCLTLRFHTTLAEKLELEPNVKLLCSFSDADYADLRQLADIL